MKILIVTDAWFPQVNGVFRTMHTVGEELLKAGHEVIFITPENFSTVPCPTYPEIRLSINAGRKLRRLIKAARPDALHILTEGPLGLAARRWCLRNGFPFTTAFHTRFPDYVYARFRLPVRWSWAAIRWFHGPATNVMVATTSLVKELASYGITNTTLWTRAVDLELFKPRKSDVLKDVPGPIFMYVGRVAFEKNIDAFLNLDLPGSKVVVGGGPRLSHLKSSFPNVYFAGEKHGEQLAEYFSAADVFVFPSLTDTFGLVLLEALVCGVPVAAYPVAGPRDVVTDPKAGILDEYLATAAQRALSLSKEDARAHAMQYSWGNCAQIFVNNLFLAENALKNTA